MNRGASEAELGWVDSILDPDVLTMGFARRVPSYKRLTLMLRDPARLKALLLHPQRPIQIVIAGKAHPADEGGKKLIQEMVRFADDPEVRHRIVFVPDYDIALAQPMYPGCDVWLNNPLRPYEACGTSGMKAALNGALNLSIRDGWWDEWYDDEFGWAIPSAEGIEDTDRRDDLEAHALYDLIEKQVAPRFYDGEVPGRWIEMLRHTIKELGPKVLATRMVRDYVEQLYVPAAMSSRLLNSTYDGARDLAAWKKKVRAAWPQIRVDHVELQGLGDVPQLGTTVGIRAFVTLGELKPSDIDVEALHGRVDSADEITDPVRVSLSLAETYEGNRHRFEGELKLDRTGPFGYTVRVVPKHPMLASPAELGLAAGPSDPEDPIPRTCRPAPSSNSLNAPQGPALTRRGPCIYFFLRSRPQGLKTDRTTATISSVGETIGGKIMSPRGMARSFASPRSAISLTPGRSATSTSVLSSRLMDSFTTTHQYFVSPYLLPIASSTPVTRQVSPETVIGQTATNSSARKHNAFVLSIVGPHRGERQHRHHHVDAEPRPDGRDVQHQHGLPCPRTQPPRLLHRRRRRLQRRATHLPLPSARINYLRSWAMPGTARVG